MLKWFKKYFMEDPEDKIHRALYEERRLSQLNSQCGNGYPSHPHPPCPIPKSKPTEKEDRQ
jgi:hypothetical protein